MDHIDPATVRQVWQRVAAPAAAPDRRDLTNLILNAAETAALYRSLMNGFPGKKDRIRPLAETQQTTLYTLMGLRRLAQTGGNSPKLPEIQGKSSAWLLDQAFRRSKAALTEYTARTIDPDFGPVFRVLSLREEQNCAAIAALLGGAF